MNSRIEEVSKAIQADIHDPKINEYYHDRDDWGDVVDYSRGRSDLPQLISQYSALIQEPGNLEFLVKTAIDVGNSDAVRELLQQSRKLSDNDFKLISEGLTPAEYVVKTSQTWPLLSEWNPTQSRYLAERCELPELLGKNWEYEMIILTALINHGQGDVKDEKEQERISRSILSYMVKLGQYEPATLVFENHKAIIKIDSQMYNDIKAAITIQSSISHILVDTLLMDCLIRHIQDIDLLEKNKTFVEDPGVFSQLACEAIATHSIESLKKILSIKYLADKQTKKITDITNLLAFAIEKGTFEDIKVLMHEKDINQSFKLSAKGQAMPILNYLVQKGKFDMAIMLLEDYFAEIDLNPKLYNKIKFELTISPRFLSPVTTEESRVKLRAILDQFQLAGRDRDLKAVAKEFKEMHDFIQIPGNLKKRP
jgi:hypothetical protein